MSIYVSELCGRTFKKEGFLRSLINRVHMEETADVSETITNPSSQKTSGPPGIATASNSMYDDGHDSWSDKSLT